MSSSRLLILGAVRLKQPTHGYDIRKELESWQADRWANIAYGSIYHALNRMAQEGLLKSEESSDRHGGTSKLLYSITPKGEAAFNELLAEYWQELKPTYDPFQAALTFMPFMPRGQIIEALTKRIDNAKKTIAELEQRSKLPTPPYVGQNIKLSIGYNKTFINWAQETKAKLEAGELVM